MKFTAIAVLLFAATVAFGQQQINFPTCDKVQPGAVIAPPDGSTYHCVDGQWKRTPDWLPTFVNAHNATYLFGGLTLLVVLFGCSFTIHTKQAGIVERWSKFHRIAEAGLNFKMPFIDSLVYTEDLNMQLMDVPVNSKTKDDATVTVPVRVQYYVLPEKVREAYYELDDPEDQIKAHVENVILSYVPTLSLDQTYEQETQIAVKVKTVLAESMAKFGYAIENALVTQIVPAANVVAAMNDINAARREMEATKARAEATKITMIATAEAEKQAQILAGEGVAGEQKAIVDGLRDSLKDFEDGVQGVTAADAMRLIMMARYFDALKEIGAANTTILLPHSPSAVVDIENTLRNALLTGQLAAK